MFNQFKAFASDESGVTAIEYGLIAALVAVAAASAFTNIGTKLLNIFNKVDTKLVVPT